MWRQSSFTRYLGVYDLFNELGHFFKIAAYYPLYRAVIVTGLENPTASCSGPGAEKRSARQGQCHAQAARERAEHGNRQTQRGRTRERSSGGIPPPRQRDPHLRTGPHGGGLLFSRSRLPGRCDPAERGDYPYSYASGSRRIHQARSPLCRQDDQGALCITIREKPLLECLCGSVILGNAPSSMPFRARELLDQQHHKARIRDHRGGSEDPVEEPVQHLRLRVGRYSSHCAREKNGWG